MARTLSRSSSSISQNDEGSPCGDPGAEETDAQADEPGDEGGAMAEHGLGDEVRHYPHLLLSWVAAMKSDSEIQVATPLSKRTRRL